MVSTYLSYKIATKVKNGPFWWPAEKRFDPSILKPTKTLSLTNFSFNPGLGAPVCKAAWYAFRYVKLDGSYGPLSEWTEIPVQAGKKEQPCLNGDCTSMCKNSSGKEEPCVLTGENSCHCNNPVLGVTGQFAYNTLEGEWYTVIHRQLDNFDPTKEGTPIGTLFPNISNPRGVTYIFPDIVFNENSGSSCDWC